MRKTIYFSISLLFILCIFGCNISDKKQHEQNNLLSDQPLAVGPTGDAITQVATINALLAGVYDGHMIFETLRTFGDFVIYAIRQ